MIESYIKKIFATKAKREKAENCPDAEFLASYMDNLLSDEQRQRMERHLVDCDACLTELILSSESAEEIALPKEGGPIDVIINFLKKGAEVISHLADVVPLPLPAPVLVRGVGEMQPQTAGFSRKFGPILVEFEVKKTRENLGEIKVRAAHDDILLNNIRISLFHGGKELESHLTMNGEVLFENCPFDCYTITLDKKTVHIGSIEIKIVEQAAD